jgi:hypothetical protein
LPDYNDEPKKPIKLAKINLTNRANGGGQQLPFRPMLY